jgi:hypothetical protein
MAPRVAYSVQGGVATHTHGPCPTGSGASDPPRPTPPITRAPPQSVLPPRELASPVAGVGGSDEPSLTAAGRGRGRGTSADHTALRCPHHGRSVPCELRRVVADRRRVAVMTTRRPCGRSTVAPRTYRMRSHRGPSTWSAGGIARSLARSPRSQPLRGHRGGVTPGVAGLFVDLPRRTSL